MNRDELLNELTETMIRMKRAMHGHMRSAILPLPVSGSQLEVLFTIFHHQPVSASNLAKDLGLTAGAVSQLVESLVQLDLITRRADPDDRRTQLLEVSANGKTHLEALKKHRNETFKQIMTELSDEELQTFLVLQRKMLIGTQHAVNVTNTEKD